MAKKQQEYGAGQIQVLEGLEPVRKRPGMYIGSTGPEGLHHLIREVVDNAIDEALAGYASKVEVTIEEDGSVTVFDDGRGIPVDKHEKTEKSALETVMTVLHAGGKFGGPESGYKVSGGLHGVGVSVVNALSTELTARVYRDGKIYEQVYNYGITDGEIEEIGETEKSGTEINFNPDPKIFETTEVDFDKAMDYLRHQAYLTKGIRTQLVDKRNGRAYSFYFDGGIRSYVRHLNRGKDTLHDDPFYIEKEIEDAKVEVAFQYADTYNENIRTFANNIFNSEGGTHLTGFKTALTRNMNEYAREYGLLKEGDDNFTGEDCREGITAIISIKLMEPQFEGQTKSKLGNPEARGYVEQVMNEWLAYWLEENPRDAKSILKKAQLAAKARVAARAARDTVIRKGALEGGALPYKLSDCSNRDPEESEIYIVEGNSAGASAKEGRDSTFQAILALRGKVLNVERVRLDRMLDNKELKEMIMALGTGIGETFDIDNLRYGRIIIMTDADVDGAHIRTLLLTFFFRYMPEVIKQGHLYIAQPPLYLLKKGKERIYVYSEEEKVEILKDMIAKKQDEDEKDPSKIIQEKEEQDQLEEAGVSDMQRYKGLGEMNADQLWQTTMNPEHRILLRVTIEDAEKADAVFNKLMGKDVSLRKNFIQTHAKGVENLDI